MGHYTFFSLNILNVSDEEKFSITEHLRNEVSAADIAFNELGENDGYSQTWYNHDEDMMTFSRNYPDAVFVLCGDGDNNDDDWITYYKNGKAQLCVAQVTYPPYDESKLVDSLDD